MKKYFFKETGDELPQNLESVENIEDILKDLLEKGIIIEKDDGKHDPIDFSDDEPENEVPEEDNEDSFDDVPTALLTYIDYLNQVLVAMTDEIIHLDSKVAKMDKSIKKLGKTIASLASCPSTDPITRLFSAPRKERTITIF